MTGHAAVTRPVRCLTLPRPFWLLGCALALGASLLAVVLVGKWSERAWLADQHERNAAWLELHATVLDQELARYHSLPAAVGLNPEVQGLLLDPDGSAAANRVDRFLQALNDEAGASELYVIDRTGKVLAASNWNQAISFVGIDLSYRPYFQEALWDGLGLFYGIGTTSSEPGYYYAKVILVDGRAIGVAAVKVSLVELQSPWRQHPNRAAMVVDSDGVIILASEPDWRYRTLAPLPQATLERFRIIRQFENVRLEPLGMRTDRMLDAGARLISIAPDDGGEHRRFLLQERRLAPSDWKMIVLSDLEDLDIIRLTAQTASGLGFGLAIALALFLWQRRRVIRLELAAKRLLEEANLELERCVAERTGELLAAQDRLVHASRLAALGQMAAVVSHELNQPLSALRTLSDNAVTLIQRERLPEAERNLGMIGQIVERMGKISGQLKLFAAKPPAPGGPAALVPCVEHAKTVLASRLHDQNVVVELHLGIADLQVRVDAGRLEQALINLMTNALDALGEQDDGRVDIEAGLDGDRVLIAVRDNGPGIPGELLPQLTEAFFTTKSVGSGLGLGLTIVESIVREAGGALDVRNHEAGGAEFLIELPRWQGPGGDDG